MLYCDSYFTCYDSSDDSGFDLVMILVILVMHSFLTIIWFATLILYAWDYRGMR